jgi:hypothetical protein
MIVSRRTLRCLSQSTDIRFPPGGISGIKQRTSHPTTIGRLAGLHYQLPTEQIGKLNIRGFDVTSVSAVTDFIGALRNQGTNIAIIDIGLKGGEDGRKLVDLVYETWPIRCALWISNDYKWVESGRRACW